MNKKNWMWVGIVVVVVVVGFIMFSGGDETSSVSEDDNAESSGVQDNLNEGSSSSGGVLDTDVEEEMSDDEGEMDDENGVDWLNYELTDVLTGETYKISDFEGKPILLESFAVWCPTCTGQQKNVKDLHKEEGYGHEDVISIALDTDPNEDADTVKDHATSNGFDWRYSVAPQELTQAMIDEFGSGFVSAPSVPMILVCEDLSFRKLDGFGKRNVDELKEEIAAGCSN